MSKSYSAICQKVVNAMLIPMSSRQKNKTKARLISKLKENSYVTIPTKRGNLKFNSLSGAGAASAIANFFNDEPETLEWIDQYVKPGDVVWDIGACIGIYSAYAALDKAVNVFAFDVSPLNFNALVEHIMINDMGGNITPIQIALSSTSGLSRLNMQYYDVGTAGNSVGDSAVYGTAYEPVYSQMVPTLSGDAFIDTFKLTPPTHIKLDVDGIEAEILKGLSQTLTKVSSLIVEVEGDNLTNFEAYIQRPLAEAGLHELKEYREKGSKRNRLFLRS